MWWTNLSVGLQNQQWMTDNVYPGTSGTARKNNCQGWPIIPPYYNCSPGAPTDSDNNTVTGLWGTQFINTSAQSAGLNSCPNIENATGAYGGNCTGPKDINIRPQLLHVADRPDDGPGLWTTDMLTSWAIQTTIPSFAYGAEKLPWAIAAVPTTPTSGSVYTLSGVATAAIGTASASGTVSCQVTDLTQAAGGPAYGADNITTIPATPGTVNGKALQTVSCTTPSALTPGHQYEWRLSVTQTSPATPTFDSESVPFVVPAPPSS